MSPRESGNESGLFLAGHPALDFLNTRMRVDDGFVDLFERDADVLMWLKQAGFRVPRVDGKPESWNLLSSARVLRESVRSLIESRKKAKRGDPSVINEILAVGHGYPQLIWSNANKPTIETVRGRGSAESVLAPIAEAAAELLTRGDFDLVKQCQDENCVRWFWDQTKSHRRRWCSMELCGNRHKVAAYRNRCRDQKVER